MSDDLTRFKRHYKQGSVLFMEGETGGEMYIILSGQVLIYRVVPKEIELHEGAKIVSGTVIQPIATLHEGEFFGEMGLLDHQPRSACAIAHSPLEVVAIDASNLESILAAKPEFAVRMLREMARRLRQKSRA